MSQRHILRWGFSTLHNRYTFLIDHARLLVRVPPPPKKEDAEAWELLKHLRNDDVAWMSVWITDRQGRGRNPGLGPYFKSGSAGGKLAKLTAASDQPFLRGLDGPNKFVAAHVLLSRRHNRLFMESNPRYPTDGSYAVKYRKLSFRLRMDAPQFGLNQIGNASIPTGALTLHPGQLSTIRDMWHDALDRTLVSFSIWWVAGGALVLFAFQCATALRRLKRLRSGRCIRCGYDLRASTGVCPECGSPIIQNAPARSAVP